jgi:Tfp pilus assembly protein PilX
MFVSNRSLHDPQAGGITIIVTLMLLVLLTVAAMGMSKNAMRELAISGTSRQGAMARNVADSGIEMSVYWLEGNNSLSATGTAVGLRNLKTKLLEDPALAGRAYSPIDQGLYPTSVLPTPQADMVLGSLSGTTQGFTIGLTRMGKLPIANMSQGNGPAAFSPAQGNESKSAPDLWALRSDSQIQVGSGLLASRFFHSKEAWVSTPVGN